MFVTAQPATDRLERKKQGYSRGPAHRGPADDRRGQGADRGSGAARQPEATRPRASTARRCTSTWTASRPPAAAIRNRERGDRPLPGRSRTWTRCATVARDRPQLKEDVFGQRGCPRAARSCSAACASASWACSASLGTNQVNDAEMRARQPQGLRAPHHRPEVLHGRRRRPRLRVPGEGRRARSRPRRRRSRRSCAAATAASRTSRSRTSARRCCASARRWTCSSPTGRWSWPRIAGISLLVGGIGIFSVMQISISRARLRDRPAQVDRGHRRRDLRPVPDRVRCRSRSWAASSAAALGYGITLLAGQAFEDGLAVSPLGPLPGRGLRARDRPGRRRLARRCAPRASPPSTRSAARQPASRRERGSLAPETAR